MSRIDTIIELIMTTEMFEQNKRAQTIQKGALALLLRENVRYQKNGNSFVITVNGIQYAISKIYLEKYLGQSLASKIESRNLNQAIDLNFYNYQNIQIQMEDNEEKQIKKMEETLSSLYGDVVDNNRTLSSLTENKRLRDENARLRKQLDEANDVIEMLKAELDKFNILMIRSRDESYDEISIPEYNDSDDENFEEIDDEIYDEDTDIQEEDEEDEIIEEQDDDEDVVNYDDIMTDVNMDNAIYNDENLYQQTPEEEPESVEEQPENTEEPVENNEPAEEEGLEESQYGIFPYKEDDIYQMAKQEFVFNYALISVLDNEDNVIDSVEVTIVPLVTNVHYPRILVWVVHNQETKTLWFKSAKSGVNVDCDSFIINIKAKMTGPKFKTFIRLANENFPYKINVETKNFDGSKGHLYLNYEDQKIHISPINFKNDEDGYANFIYCIEDDGELVQCGDSSEGDVYIEDADEPLKIIAKWSDNSLFGTISY